MNRSREAPAGFDRNQAEKRFYMLRSAVEKALGYSCHFSTGVEIQDASFHGEIVIPREKWKDDYPITVRASNFNDLVCIQHEGDLEQNEREALIKVFRELKYRYISFDEVSEKNLWPKYFEYL